MFQPESATLTIKYFPDNNVLTENPPRFTWMPAGEDTLRYTLEIANDKEFLNIVAVKENIPYNFYTLSEPLKDGEYFWRYFTDSQDGKSKVRSFTIPKNTDGVKIPEREVRYVNAEEAHPRIWLNSKQIEDFKKSLRENKSYSKFDDFYQLSVLPQVKNGFPKEPPRYPNDKRVIDIWRGNYMTCQQALNYIRNLSVAGVILEDKNLLHKAKNALLEIISWDTNGSTSRDYNDECSFRVCYAIAFGFDWLYNELSESERESVLNVLLTRTKQVADHVIVNSRIHYALYDSHAVRSLSSVLTPACIAMLFHNNEAQKLLDYTVEYFSAIYTPWGGDNGGWAEGPMYWTTGMAFLTDALNLIKAYIGIDFYQRPFFKQTANFPLYCNPYDTYRACFCDQSNIGQKPGMKTAFLARQFGAEGGLPESVWYFNKILERSELTPEDFFNKGWWDLPYDNMVYHYYFGEFKEKAPSNKLQVKFFKDIGWVSLNKNMNDEENHLFFLTKSSPYGCVSHSHGDQNSFLLHAFGEPLVIQTGHYIGFGSKMHLDYRRQTKSHNTLLIDGKGQYAGMEKEKQLSAKGQICEVTENKDYIYIKEDATKAYQENIDGVKSCVREIYFIDETYFVIIDTVNLEKAAPVSFQLHALNKFNIAENSVELCGEKADLSVKFLHSASSIDGIAQTNEFEGADKAEIEGLETHWHLSMKTKSAKKHQIVTLLHPKKKHDESYIPYMKDDQGHDINIYTDNNGKIFTLILAGNNRY